MKSKLALLLLTSAIALFAQGCSSTNIAKLAQAINNDPATVCIKISSVYGTASITRVGNLQTNTTATVSPDGTVTIKTP